MATIYASTKSAAVTAFEAAREQVGKLGSRAVTFAQTRNGKVALGIAATVIAAVALSAIAYGIYTAIKSKNAKQQIMDPVAQVFVRAKMNGAAPVVDGFAKKHLESQKEVHRKELAQLSLADVNAEAQRLSKINLQQGTLTPDLRMRFECARECLEKLEDTQLATAAEAKRKAGRSFLEEVSEDGVITAAQAYPMATVGVVAGVVVAVVAAANLSGK